MSEGQPSHAPMRIDTFTPKQLDRLDRFRHVLEKVHEVDTDIGKGVTAFGFRDQQGGIPPQNILFHFDQRLLYHLNQAAYRIYESDFVGDPALRQAAEGIQHDVEEKHTDKAVLSPRQLSDLYSRD